MNPSLVIFLLCVGFAAAVTFRASSEASEATEWEAFKATFQKNYITSENEETRRAVFEQNLKRIRQHNYEADLGKHSYRQGINEYSDLTPAEYRKFLLGFRQRATLPPLSSTFLPPSNVRLPMEVDWRKHDLVTKVKNQGQCGSCWAFSATGSLEGQHAKKTGKLVSLSEQQLIDCSKKFGNAGCNGGLMDDAFKYIKANGGIDTEKSYPYHAQDMTCHFKKKFVGATVTGFMDIKSGNETALKVAVATVGPISVGINAARSGFATYKSGVYDDPDCSPSGIDHGVLVVGYGRTTGENAKDFWIVKNSWGDSWGMNGYILMRRNRNNQCGIATVASFPLV